MDSKKIASYLTLIFGIFIIAIVFFLHSEDFSFTTNLNLTYFDRVFYRKFGLGSDLIKFMWWILLIGFTFSWWRLRNKITNLLLKFHTKV
tara:strand:+ start:37 stop:306 length:270 start_codon:yes stop_codon:yes gene_type:complete